MDIFFGLKNLTVKPRELWVKSLKDIINSLTCELPDGLSLGQEVFHHRIGFNELGVFPKDGRVVVKKVLAVVIDIIRWIPMPIPNVTAPMAWGNGKVYMRLNVLRFLQKPEEGINSVFNKGSVHGEGNVNVIIFVQSLVYIRHSCPCLLILIENLPQKDVYSQPKMSWFIRSFYGCGELSRPL